MKNRKIEPEDLGNEIGNVFILVNLASRRVRELASGAPRLIETKEDDPIQIALEEIAEGKIVPGKKGDKEQSDALQQQKTSEEKSQPTTEEETSKKTKTGDKEDKKATKKQSKKKKQGKQKKKKKKKE
jgi:DNA-directed RNA polymerase omega subunit